MKYFLILLTIGMLAAGCSKTNTPDSSQQQSTTTDQTSTDDSTQSSNNTSQTSNSSPASNPTNPTSTTPSSSTTTKPSSSGQTATGNTTTPTTSTGEKKYTMSEVSAANSESNCLSVVSGSVYNLTSYMSKHPGGKKQILSICGKDGTSAFLSQHGSNSKVNSMLSGFKVGVLTN